MFDNDFLRRIKPYAVMRIRDVYPRFYTQIRIFPSRIRIFSHPGSRIRIKEFKYFNPRKLFLSFRKYDLGCSSPIRILIFTHPGSRGQNDTGSRVRNNVRKWHRWLRLKIIPWKKIHADRWGVVGAQYQGAGRWWVWTSVSAFPVPQPPLSARK